MLSSFALTKVTAVKSAIKRIKGMKMPQNFEQELKETLKGLTVEQCDDKREEILGKFWEGMIDSNPFHIRANDIYVMKAVLGTPSQLIR